MTLTTTKNHTEELHANCMEHRLGEGGRAVAIVGESMVIHGSATARDGADLLILGEIHGPVHASGAVVITKSAKVHGGVQCSRLCVIGELNAAAAPDGPTDVVVEGLLDVRKTGVVRATNISYVNLRSEAGGRLSGMIQYLDRADSDSELDERPSHEGHGQAADAASDAASDAGKLGGDQALSQHSDVPSFLRQVPTAQSMGLRKREFPADAALAEPHAQATNEPAAQHSKEGETSTAAPEDAAAPVGLADDVPADLMEPTSGLRNLVHLPKLDGTFGAPRGG